MQLYFIRHGQSQNNEIWAQTGSTKSRDQDPDLTEIGRRQVEYLVDFLSLNSTTPHLDFENRQNVSGFPFTHLYTSLMVRSIMTGLPLAQRCGVPLVAWEEIHETGGIYLDDEISGKKVGQPGKGRSELQRLFPILSIPESIGEEGWWNRPYEEPEERPERARRVLQTLFKRHGNSDHKVVMISHGGFFNDFMFAALGMESGHDSNVWFALNNVAVTRLDFNEERTALVYLNRLDFLPRYLIT